MSVQIDPRIDHYKILGVKPDAKGEDIKKAYRRLAKQCHPDSTGGDKAKEARFKEISQAYDILGDKDKREQYDALRSGAEQFHQFQGFPGGFGGGVGGAGGLDDLFAQMFQGAGARRGNVHVRIDPGARGGPFAGPFAGPGADRPRRRRQPAEPAKPKEQTIRLADGSSARKLGHDVHSDLRLSLDQAVLGTVAEVTTLDGTAKVKVPPGTSSGVRLRLKHKGALADGGHRGHHYVTVHIDVPKHVDEKAKELLIQFMQRTKR
jgi:DnaJ-class molecular chaperone